jgi:hypothetical protein
VPLRIRRLNAIRRPHFQTAGAKQTLDHQQRLATGGSRGTFTDFQALSFGDFSASAAHPSGSTSTIHPVPPPVTSISISCAVGMASRRLSFTEPIPGRSGFTVVRAALPALLMARAAVVTEWILAGVASQRRTVDCGQAVAQLLRRHSDGHQWIQVGPRPGCMAASSRPSSRAMLSRPTAALGAPHDRVPLMMPDPDTARRVRILSHEPTVSTRLSD